MRAEQGTRTISVIGGARATREQRRWAHEVGRGIAERGHVLLCGGRGGVMEAACQGAHEAGGLTVGVLPGEDRGAGNPYLTVALPTGLGEARNLIVARGGDAVIAIDGSYGTLSEIALALKAGIRVVGLSTWSGRDGSGQEMALEYANSPQQAVDMACAGFGSETTE